MEFGTTSEAELSESENIQFQGGSMQRKICKNELLLHNHKSIFKTKFKYPSYYQICVGINEIPGNCKAGVNSPSQPRIKGN
jgi:hypothetical protein